MRILTKTNNDKTLTNKKKTHTGNYRYFQYQCYTADKKLQTLKITKQMQQNTQLERTK